MNGLEFYLDPNAVDAAAGARMREVLKDALAAMERRGPHKA
jgi:hypothetical protein